jgi:peptide/nickel transport system permease protein
MWAYTVRKILLTIPIVLGIVLITFLLSYVAAPDPARAYAGKQKSEAQLQAIRHQMWLDKPKWEQFLLTMCFQFPPSMRYQESVWTLIGRKGPVSLAIQFPAFMVELGLQLVIALYGGSRRGRLPDYLVTFLSVLGISAPVLSVYIGMQWFFGGYLKWFPVAGWDRGFFYALHFAALPILATVIVGLGGGTRFYRTVVLEEINSDYVRTARAKGVGNAELLLTHVLRNVMIPVVTNTVIALPFLITGALLLERLFQIPGMGGLLVEAIETQDNPVVMAIVYTTAIAYCLMLLVTDICYTLVDPRVSLK